MNKKLTHPLISGWIGHGNFGDELMAEIIRQYLAIHFESLKFTYYKVGKLWNSVQSFHGHDIDFLHKENTKKIFEKLRNMRTMRRYDALFFGGGSIFHSHNSINWKLKLLKNFKKNTPDAPTAALGISLGPFCSTASEKLCTQFLNTLDFSLVRDQASLQLAKKLGVTKPVCSCSDIVFTLPNIIPEMFISHAQDQNLIGCIFLSHKKIDVKHKLFLSLLNGINLLLAQGKKIRLFTFCLGDDSYDSHLNALLKATCSEPNRVEIITFSGDLFNYMKMIQECSKLISMRFHGLILAFLFSIPFASISYHVKNSFFLQDINYPKNLQILEENISNKTMHDLISSLIEVDSNAWKKQYASFREEFSKKEHFDTAFMHIKNNIIVK